MSQALDAGDRLHRAVTDVGRHLSQEIRLRVGLHAGDFFFGSLDNGSRYQFTVVGHAVNLAARVQKFADPGSTRVTEVASRFVGPGWKLGPSSGDKPSGFRVRRVDRE